MIQSTLFLRKMNVFFTFFLGTLGYSLKMMKKGFFVELSKMMVFLLFLAQKRPVFALFPFVKNCRILWRNGLKILSPNRRIGSSPIAGTKAKNAHFGAFFVVFSAKMAQNRIFLLQVFQRGNAVFDNFCKFSHLFRQSAKKIEFWVEIFEFPPFFRALGKNWVKNFAFLGIFRRFFRIIHFLCINSCLCVSQLIIILLDFRK